MSISSLHGLWWNFAKFHHSLCKLHECDEIMHSIFWWWSVKRFSSGKEQILGFQLTCMIVLTKSLLLVTVMSLKIRLHYLWVKFESAYHANHHHHRVVLTDRCAAPWPLKISVLHRDESGIALASSWTRLSQVRRGRPGGLVQLNDGFLPSWLFTIKSNIMQMVVLYLVLWKFTEYGAMQV